MRDIRYIKDPTLPNGYEIQWDREFNSDYHGFMKRWLTTVNVTQSIVSHKKRGRTIEEHRLCRRWWCRHCESAGLVSDTDFRRLVDRMPDRAQ